MRFEVVENSGEWIVRRQGVELARFGGQDQALSNVAQHLREVEDTGGSVALAVRYEARN